MELETNEVQEREIVATAVERGANLPLTILLIALVLWFGFQTLQLASERANLNEARAHQEAAMQEAQKLRTQFESLISKLSDLANKGHAGAKLVMDELQKRGVTAQPETMIPKTLPETITPKK
jgi:predicted negative regulator of RcsB-dependent stress response